MSIIAHSLRKFFIFCFFSPPKDKKKQNEKRLKYNKYKNICQIISEPKFSGGTSDNLENIHTDIEKPRDKLSHKLILSYLINNNFSS